MERHTCSWAGKVNIVKMNILHIIQGNQQIQSKSYQNTSVIFKVLQQVLLNFVWTHKRSQADKDIQRKNRMKVSYSRMSDYNTKLQ